ncbi:MAG: bifunctional riboflavin kinase/FMN adenylyltransferase [Spirochaetota bacterium]|nr:bifunctional riboflavin kinase/FMN adenylyltransferase [Spirochaetota bacterium]
MSSVSHSVMRYASLSAWRASGAERAIYTIGNFDGVHRGHQALIAELVARARENDALAVAVSFCGHTRDHFGHEQRKAPLSTREDRARLLEALGVDALIELEFDAALAALHGQDFLRALAGQGWCGFVLGEDFRFGAGRASDARDIAHFLDERGGKLVTLPPLCDNGERVSSSRIRALLLAGGVEGARVLLGREYVLRGVRVSGDGIASRLGYPTVNLGEIAALIPGNGVYAAYLRYAGRLYPALSYIGTRPTHTSGSCIRVEAHTLDSSPEVAPGEDAELIFAHRIREERCFPDETALLEQLALDAAAARGLILS